MVLEYNLSFCMKTAGKMPAKEEKNQMIKDRAEQLNRAIKENKNLWIKT